ncbi:MAG: dihydroorotase [Actinomycetota bacterium]|nr:dihydroorotase [Actinomycetota bacterium]
MSGRIVFKGAVLLDRTGIRAGDLAIEGDLITSAEAAVEPGPGDTVVDARGGVVLPALVDSHTHLRVPGGEEAETLASGTMAAAMGGYAAVLAMPNTTPALDNPARIAQMLAAAADLPVKVLASGTITKERAGAELSPLAALSKAGVKLVTDDGSGVQDANLMRRALQYGAELGLIVAEHCEVESLFGGGVMNEGPLSAGLGLRGIPAVAEEVMVARDIELARATRARLHLLHLSTGRSAELVERAKADGVPVTAEVTPHHLLMAEDLLRGYGSVYKVNPPLRTDEDRRALWRYLARGAFDVIGTDHAPHPRWRKEATLDDAAFGMLGLQHALSAVYTGALGALEDGVRPERLPGEVSASIAGLGFDESKAARLAWLWQIAAMMSWQPARLLGLGDDFVGRLAAGSRANLVLFDDSSEWTPTAASILSKAGNSPYLGLRLSGRIEEVVVDGRRLVGSGELISEGNWH